MPRPLSWLPRLHAIDRSVANSVRSHYDRRDLERLFELQPRAAQKLLDLMPSVKIGTSRLVEREALAGFLGRVRGRRIRRNCSSACAGRRPGTPAGS